MTYKRLIGTACGLTLALCTIVSIEGANAATKIRFGTTSASAVSWPEFIAQDKRYYAAENLNVEVTYTGNNTTVVQQLIGGSFDLGQTTFETTIRAIENRAPIVMIGSTMIKYSYSIMAQKDIKSIKDMKDKRIILALPKSALTVYWNRAVEQAGMKVSDIDRVYDGSTPNRYAALVSGTVQAAGLTQPIDLLAMDKGYNRIVDITAVAKNFGFTSLVASRNWLKQNGDTARAFLRATKKATEYFYDKKNRAEVIAILVKHTKIAPDAAAKTYDYFVNELQPYQRDLDPTDDYVRTVVQLLVDIGDYKIPNIDPKKYADRGYLPK
ncbi:MAG: PhnD/SsuA/transferrin family substrate-binding protein [Rhizobiales bacterium]|nr:PhnD/SsuA/transferrin family substrate-binding protein [Hyphomicrobiales bacterium]